MKNSTNSKISENMGFTYIIIYLQKRQGGQRISPAGRLPAAPPSDAFRNLT